MIHVAQQIDLSVGGVSLSTLIAARHHILLEGPKAWTDAVVLCLQPHFHTPIARNQSAVAFQLTGGNVGALILQDVDRLSAAEQRRVLAWMDGASRHTRIVSTTEQSLFPFVARGLFDAALYYRLNMLLLQAGPGNGVSLQVCTPVQRITPVRA
jgi:Sigma-54 interaction domain